MNTNTLFRCRFCHKACNNSAQLENHERTHQLEVLVVTCGGCGEHFNCQDMLAKHSCTASDKGRGFNCNFCEKMYDTDEELQKHVQESHHEAEKFQCSLCNGSFGGSDDLQRHLAMHSASRKYMCPICSRRFKSKLSLECHIQDHEQGIVIPSSDGVDLAASTMSSTLETFFCNVCGETFNHEEHLQQHLDRHFQRKSYECDICNSRFAGPFFLKHHMEVHKAARCHVCSQCGTGYRQKDLLIKHFRIHGVPKMEDKNEQLQEEANIKEELKEIGTFTTHLENDTDALVKENFDIQMDTDEVNFVDLLQTCESEENESTFDTDIGCFTKIRPLTEDILRHTALPNNTCHPNQIEDESLPTSGKAGDYTPLPPNQPTLQEPTLDARSVFKGKKKMIFPCDLCSKVFSMKAHCQRHRRIHTGEMPYECKVCRRKFKWRSSWATHSCLKSKERRVEGNTTTSNVSLVDSEGLLNDRHHRHGGESVSNGHLDVTCTRNANNADNFATEISQRSHMSVHDGLHPDRASSGAHVECQDNRVDRMKRNLGAKRTIPTEHSESVMPMTDGPYDQIPVTCNDAVQQKLLQRSTRRPISSETRQPTLFTQLRNTSISSYSNPSTSTCTVNLVKEKQRKVFVCEFCSKVSISRNHYLRHRRLHTGEKPFECDRCDRKFMWKSSLDSHKNSHDKSNVHTTNTDVIDHEQSDEAVQEHSDWIPEVKEERDQDNSLNFLQYGKGFASYPELQSHISIHEVTQDYTRSAPDTDTGMTQVSYQAEQVTQQRNVRGPKHRKKCHSGKLEGTSSGTEAKQNKKKFVCEYCSKVFNNLSSYQRHLPLHTGEMLHHCNICNRKFKWKSSLDSHKKSHDKKEGGTSNHDFVPFLDSKQSGELMQEQPDGTPKESKKSVGDKVFTCVVCGMGFASEMQLQIHESTHEVTNPYTGSLLRTKTDVAPFSGRAKAAPQANNSEKPKRQKKPQTKKTDQPIIQADIVHGQNSKNFVCEVCSKVFHIKHHYQRHFRIHTGEMPYQCDQCHKVFKWRSSFDCHKKSHDKKNGPVASSSDYVSLIANELTQGTSKTIPEQKEKDKDSVRTTMKPFVCPQCGTDYDSDLELHIHMFIHGDAEYLREQGYAGRHKERTDPGESSRPVLDMAQLSTAKDLPHQMQLCGPGRKEKCSTGKSSTTSSEVGAPGRRNKRSTAKSSSTFSETSAKHDQMKQGFPCEICGKVFQSRNHHQRHMPVHTGDMPFECDRCSRKFKWRSSLDSHKKSHDKKDLDLTSIEQVSFVDSEEDL